MTHYLRFPDEPTGTTALEAAGLLTEDGDHITSSHDHALDVIANIPDLDGWHINYIGPLPDGWSDYIVTPEQPVRVFF